MVHEDSPDIQSLLPTVGISLCLIILLGFAVVRARSNPGTIVLPGGITYLGPTPSPTPANAQKFSAVMGGTIPIPDNAEWVEYTGKVFPFSFDYPTTISLGTFPNDPYDSVTVFYSGTEAQGNLFFRVEKLSGKPFDHAQNWWKQYSWKGVETITTFTNSMGLKGYRARYTDSEGKTPYDHVFFEVPGRSDLIIWISGKLFTQDILNKLVDSVSWK